MKHTCKECGESNLDNFYYQNNNPRTYCKVCHIQRNRKNLRTYRKKNSEVLNSQKREWYKQNTEHVKVYNKVNKSENREIYYKKHLLWKKENPEKAALLSTRNSAKRRAIKRNATPKSWGDNELNQFIIEEAYELAQVRRKQTGIDWHVDHIIPLTNDIVCGLHVGYNLQIITSQENIKKSNTFFE